MASTTDYNFITSKTYKATRPNGSEIDLSDSDDIENIWGAPIKAAAGSGWGANFRNLKVQSLSISGHVNISKEDQGVVMTIKPTAFLDSKNNETPASVFGGYANVMETINTDLFAEDTYGSEGRAAQDPDKVVCRAVIKGEVLAGTDAWMEFTATFYNDKVVLSNYNTPNIVGAKVDAYLETLTGYKTEA